MSSFWNEFAFYVLKLSGGCDRVWEDGSAWCWGFVWSVPW